MSSSKPTFNAPTVHTTLHYFLLRISGDVGAIFRASHIFGASNGCKNLSKPADKMRSSHRCTIFQEFASVTYVE